MKMGKSGSCTDPFTQSCDRLYGCLGQGPTEKLLRGYKPILRVEEQADEAFKFLTCEVNSQVVPYSSRLSQYTLARQFLGEPAADEFACSRAPFKSRGFIVLGEERLQGTFVKTP